MASACVCLRRSQRTRRRPRQCARARTAEPLQLHSIQVGVFDRQLNLPDAGILMQRSQQVCEPAATRARRACRVFVSSSRASASSRFVRSLNATMARVTSATPGWHRSRESRRGKNSAGFDAIAVK
jgi:hypothetical protein